MKSVQRLRMVNIYVLELQGDKYYVGKTNHTFQRFNQHKSGSGAKWTQKHKVKDLFAFHKDMKDTDENKITIQMMKKYGVRNVRGGSWTKVNMTEAEIKRLEKRINARGKRRSKSPSSKKTTKSKKKINKAPESGRKYTAAKSTRSFPSRRRRRSTTGMCGRISASCR